MMFLPSSYEGGLNLVPDRGSHSLKVSLNNFGDEVGLKGAFLKFFRFYCSVDILPLPIFFLYF
jgi:hypothetical protein